MCLYIAIVDCTGTKIKIKFLFLNELKGQDAVNNLGTLYLYTSMPTKTLPLDNNIACALHVHVKCASSAFVHNKL